jgi:TPR repeat protein
MEWFKKSADQGNANAIFNLGTLYAQGIAGHVPCDYSKALELFKKASEIEPKLALFAQKMIATVKAKMN